MAYPLFTPPESLAVQGRERWSKAEAKQYFDWFIGVLPRRTEFLITYFGQEAAQDREIVLTSIGSKIAEALIAPPFSTHLNNKVDLTNEGYALAADMGLLVATYILEECGSLIYWEIGKPPKRDVNYNLPVLVGFREKWFQVEPVGASIATAFGILRGHCTPDRWPKGFKYALSMV